MPLYEYHCGDCGAFTRMRNVSECSQPADCPDCGVSAKKVFPIINLRAMRPENRKAWERNEQSRHAPHVCGSGCSHGAARPKMRAQNSDRPALQKSTKQNSRPWMLGH